MPGALEKINKKYTGYFGMTAILATTGAFVIGTEIAKKVRPDQNNNLTVAVASLAVGLGIAYFGAQSFKN